MVPCSKAKRVQTSIIGNKNNGSFRRGMALVWTLSLTLLLLAGTVNAQSECYPNQLLP